MGAVVTKASTRRHVSKSDIAKKIGSWLDIKEVGIAGVSVLVNDTLGGIRHCIGN